MRRQPVTRSQRDMARPALLVVAALVVLTGCGTTVPLTSSGSAASQGGLDNPQQGAAPGTGQPGLGGSATGTAGTGGITGTGGTGATGGTGGSGGTSLGTAGGGASGTSGGSAPGALGPQGSGSRNRKPILVGFIAADYAKLVGAFGGTGASSDPHAVNRALVRALNARGGLAGRQIKGVYFTVNGSDADYSSQEQAACASFTQDNHVELVIGNGVGSQPLYQCLLKNKVPFVTGNPTEGVDSVELSKYPNVFDIPGLATDHQAAAFMDQSVRTGWLTKKNKIGVLLSGCAWGTRTYNNVVLPRARRLGVAVEQYSLGCQVEGTAGVSAYSTAVQNAALAFRGDGVDRVMILAGSGDAATYLLFANNADSQHYYPGYIVGTNAVAQAWVKDGAVSQMQAVNTHGAGWVPVVDTTTPPQTPQMKACTKLAKDGGAPAEATPGQFGLICDTFNALQLALGSNGGAGGLDALRPALERLGSSFVSAGTIGGATEITAKKHDGAQKTAPFAYMTSCKCFRYLASPEPVE